MPIKTTREMMKISVLEFATSYAKRRTKHVYTVPASQVDVAGKKWGNTELVSVISRFTEDFFIPDAREQEQLSSPACDARFDSTTGTVNWSAR